MTRYCKILFLIAASLPITTAQAQVDLIVRLQEGSSLQGGLQAGQAPVQAAGAVLNEGVDAMWPLFQAPSPTDPRWPAWTGQIYGLSVADSATARAVRDRWAASPDVAYVQFNHRYRLDAVAPGLAHAVDPHLDSLDHVSVIRASDAWTLTTGRATVRIGFVDTGVFLEHPDLARQIWVNPGEDLNGNGQVDGSDLNGIDDDGNGYVDDLRGYDFVDRTATVDVGDYTQRDADPSDDPTAGGGRGHGTIVAGVLAAERDNGVGGVGIASGCRLVPLRAFGSDGLAEDDDVAAAILYAAEMGIDVLNLSFGDVYLSPLMQESIQYAVARGTVVVASAGNVGGDRPHYPSDYPEVISTAWLNQDGTSIAGRGTYGVGIDIGAPGTAIYTTLFPSAEQPEALFGRRSGSSMAAPMVSAAAALLKSLQPELSPAAIRSILTGAAVDIGLRGWDYRTAAGRLDVAGALVRALPGRTELVAPAHDAGVTGGVVPIVGSALDAGFREVQVFLAAEVPGSEPVWHPLVEPIRRQVLDDTLAVWDTETYADGAYLLRVATVLGSGRTVEAQHRVFLDRTPPSVDVRMLDAGLIGTAYGVVADLAIDDVAEVRLDVTLDGITYAAASDRRSRRLGVHWTDPTRRGGAAQVRLGVVNAAGLETVVERSLVIPATLFDSSWLDRTPLSVPHGFMLPTATDFDRDGLLEVTLNQYQDGWIGDTLATYEWDGTGFALAQQLIANVIPRDVGDTDGDGLYELLTQVTGATLLLEQPDPSSYPFQQAFLDTVGLANPFDDQAAFGALLADLDQDDLGEIIVHNTRAWRVLEFDGTTYTEVARLENPTTTGQSEIDRNEFQEPEALIGDPDGNGRTNLLVGDSDGDWILYEATADNTYEVVWTYETDRYNAGSRLASGDLDGDGLPEFITYTQNWTQPTRERALEPAIGRYFVWDGQADGGLRLIDSLSVWGNVSRHGSMATTDFDQDGRDELILLHPPDLYVFSWDASGTRRWRYAHTGDLGLRSMALVPADWDGDGTPGFIAAGADERLHRFSPSTLVTGVVPPQWVAAYAQDEQHVALAWNASGADSVIVYRGVGGGALDPVATIRGTSSIVPAEEVSRFALQAWSSGAASPLSDLRYVRPHAPAQVVAVTYPTPVTLQLRFTEPIAAGTDASQFQFDSRRIPRRVLLARGGRDVILSFAEPLIEPDTLRWSDLTDREGTPVAQTAVFVEPPPRAEERLHLVRWEVLGLDEVLLVFSEALDPVEAAKPANYRLTPHGDVTAASFDPNRPEEVRVRVAGQAIGATGVETALIVQSMRSAQGTTLAAEGQTASLVTPAETLDHVYVYPNPFDGRQHATRVLIAGLPVEAQVEVFSVQGGLIRRLEEDDGNGGVAWDLTDEQGQDVPSGVYLVRVEDLEGKAVLRKVAVIR